jgi:hypothetical protein
MSAIGTKRTKPLRADTSATDPKRTLQEGDFNCPRCHPSDDLSEQFAQIYRRLGLASRGADAAWRPFRFRSGVPLGLQRIAPSGGS